MALYINKTVISKEEPLDTNVCWVDINYNPPKEKYFIGNEWVEAQVDYSRVLNTPAPMVGAGTSAQRPANPPIGYTYWDTTISKQIVYNGSKYVEANGDSLEWTVTKTLTNVSIDNDATEVVKGDSYEATITADEGYEFGDASVVTITMGGSDVTSTAYTDATGEISIASVTGNLVITATATAIPEPEPTPDPEPENNGGE